jgi:outer membrane protein assembly factor BamB
VRSGHPPLRLLVPALVCLVALGILLATSGGEVTPRRDVAGSAAPPRVDWPLFGRVPERTQYLPAERRDIDPPLREAWSINTHALIEFPPAVADGVAYVVNKYGNARAVRLEDRRTLWERVTDRSDRGAPTDVTAPVYHRGLVYFAYYDGDLIAVDAATGKLAWKRNLHAHLESSPLAIGGRLYLGDDQTNLVALRARDGKVLWQFNSPAPIKASPASTTGGSSSPTTPAPCSASKRRAAI